MSSTIQFRIGGHLGPHAKSPVKGPLEVAASAGQEFYHLSSGQGLGAQGQGRLAQGRSEVVVGARLTRRVVEGSLGRTQPASKGMQLLQTGRRKVVAQKVTPEASSGFEKFVDSDHFSTGKPAATQAEKPPARSVATATWWLAIQLTAAEER